MGKTIFFVSFCLLIICNPASGQRKMKQMDPEKQQQQETEKAYEHVPWQDKITFGGNFWLSFGSNSSQVTLQPLIGYKVTDKLIAGGGFTYIYWKETYQFTNGTSLSFSDNIFGLNLFARQVLFNPLFVHAEYQPMNFNSYNYSTGESKRIWTNALYLGGGLNQSFGKGSGGAYIMVLYDVAWRQSDPFGYQKSFYASPWNIRFGMFF